MTSSSGTRFPLAKKDYDLLEEVGDGVHRARCIPLDEIVAIKICNLEKGLNDVETLREESDYTDHPNILKAYCYFKVDSSLWTVMPYMSCGSCLNIMKSVYPEGLEEPVVATLLREILKALVYLHGQSYIHRDVKAGNILVDSKGAVKLGDFGISEYIFSRLHKLRTNSGTPYWMPPEDMQEFYSYDSSEDIWSFGITALELAHGPAPFLKYPPMKVLQMTLENAYSIFYKPEKIKLSKSFRELVASCLVKDPKKRPTAEKLLKYPFFRHSSNIHLSITLLDGLSPLGQRYKKLKDEDAKYHGTKEQLSLQKYIDDIKNWPHFKYQIPKDELETFQSSEEEKELSEEEKELSEEEKELSEEEKELSEEE